MNVSRFPQLKAARATLVAAIVLFAAQAAFCASEGKFDRTLSVSGPVSLSVTTGSGDVHVTPGGDGSVVVHARVRAHGWSDADQRVKEVVDNPPIEQTGNVIRIGRKEENHWGHNVSIDYEITTPRQTGVNLNSGSGNINANGFTGDFKVGSGSGDLTVDNMQGNGTASTGSGTIHLKDLSGAAKVDTGSGDIEVSQRTRAEVQARTGSGSIRISGAQDMVRAHTGSGDVEVSGNPNAAWRLGTGSGSVTLSLAGDSKFDLDASSGSGEIHCDKPITMQGSIDRHHVHGAINGGGPTLYVETGSGDIRVH